MSWNPITGCEGPNGVPCPYCYARKIAARYHHDNLFWPKFHPDRLTAPQKRRKPTRIFLGSMTDMFGVGVKPEWVAEVIGVVRQCPQHTFMVLTKRPDRIVSMFERAGIDPADPIPNLWLGTSVEDQSAAHRIRSLFSVPGPWFRFISFEPLLGEVAADLFGIDWIIIGARTNPTLLPKSEWIQRIIDRAHGTPVFLKDSVVWYWPEKLRQIPEVEA
jgi:protein gp37